MKEETRLSEASDSAQVLPHRVQAEDNSLGEETESSRQGFWTRSDTALGSHSQTHHRLAADLGKVT